MLAGLGAVILAVAALAPGLPSSHAASPSSKHSARSVQYVSCIPATGPTGNGTVLLSALNEVSGGPTNNDAMDITKLGLETVGGDLVAHVYVVNLGNLPNNNVRADGIGNVWFAEFGGPPAGMQYFLAARYPGIHPEHNGTATPPVDWLWGRMIYNGTTGFSNYEVDGFADGTFDFANSAVVIKVPYATLGMTLGTNLIGPNAETREVEGTFGMFVGGPANTTPDNPGLFAVDSAVQNNSFDYVLGHRTCTSTA